MIPFCSENETQQQIYQYINQQTTYTFRTNDQYRSWTLNTRHRQTCSHLKKTSLENFSKYLLRNVVVPVAR